MPTASYFGSMNKWSCLSSDPPRFLFPMLKQSDIVLYVVFLYFIHIILDLRFLLFLMSLLTWPIFISLFKA
jgi:hypothetical protein